LGANNGNAFPIICFHSTIITALPRRSNEKPPKKHQASPRISPAIRKPLFLIQGTLTKEPCIFLTNLEREAIFRKKIKKSAVERAHSPWVAGVSPHEENGECIFWRIFAEDEAGKK
jgi:hypothetical protein